MTSGCRAPTTRMTRLRGCHDPADSPLGGPSGPSRGSPVMPPREGPAGPAPGGVAARAVVDGVDLDAVAAAVRSCPAIDDLSAGPWGGVVSYLPGRQLAGVLVASDHVEISVRGRWGVPVAEMARQVRTALAGLVGSRRVDLEVADLTDAPGEVPAGGPREEVSAWPTSSPGGRPGASSSGPIIPTAAATPPSSSPASPPMTSPPPVAPLARVVIVADTPWLVSLLRPVLRRMGWRRPPPRVK